MDDLGQIIRDRRSTKKLNSPLIGGKKSPTGQIRKGNSVPAHVFQNKETFEHGISSYHRGHHENLGEVLSNQFIKESMIKKIVSGAADLLNEERKKKVDWRNNAFNVRSQSINVRLD